MSKSGYNMFRTLNIFISVVMASFLVVASFLTTLIYTFGNEEFVNKKINENTACKEQNEEFYSRLDIISENYSIPEEVLRNAMKPSNLNSFQHIAVRALSTQKKFSIKQTESIEKYCTDALEAYSKDNFDCLDNDKIEKIVDEIAQTVDEIYRIENISDFSLISQFMNARRLSLADVICVVVACALAIVLTTLNSKRTSTLIYIGVAFATAGEINVALPLIYRFMGIGKGLQMTNINAYNKVIDKIINYQQQFNIAIGIIFIILAVILFVTAFRHYKPILKNVDYERELDRNLL